MGIKESLVQTPEQIKLWNVVREMKTVNDYGVTKNKGEEEWQLLESGLTIYERTLWDGAEPGVIDQIVQRIKAYGDDRDIDVWARAMIRLIPKDPSGKRIIVMGSDYKGVTADNLRIELIEKGITDANITDYYILERQYPSISNIHSIAIVVQNNQMFFEIGGKLYELIGGKPGFSFYCSYLRLYQDFDVIMERSVFNNYAGRNLSKSETLFMRKVFSEIIDKGLLKNGMNFEATCDNPADPTDVHFEECVYRENDESIENAMRFEKKACFAILNLDGICQAEWNQAYRRLQDMGELLTNYERERMRELLAMRLRRQKRNTSS